MSHYLHVLSEIEYMTKAKLQVRPEGTSALFVGGHARHVKKCLLNELFL